MDFEICQIRLNKKYNNRNIIQGLLNQRCKRNNAEVVILLVRILFTYNCMSFYFQCQQLFIYIFYNIYIIESFIQMFVVEALYPFSSLTIKNNEQQQKQQKNSQQIINKAKGEQICLNDKQNQSQRLQEGQNQQIKRNRSASQQKQLLQINSDKIQKKISSKYSQEDVQKQKKVSSQIQKIQQNQISYLNFQTGDKILVRQAHQNGWWYGNTIKQPSFIGFFPSNFVKIGSKPPPPPKEQNSEQQQSQIKAYNPYDDGAVDWVSNELRKVQKGPVQSAYYLGIKGYKNVKIDQKNQNILKGDHVKFDVSTGLAKVPVKDQAPAAKAVRQMGYYFDYHQWCQERNKTPDSRARPDASKKKKKKLNLKFMN